MKPGVDAFLVFEGKVLLVQRDNIPLIPYPNYWNLPGGGIDIDESDDEAIVREVEEEVGLKSLEFIFISKDTFENGCVVSKYFAKLTKKQKDAVNIKEEGQAFGFFTLDEVFKKQINPNLRSYLATNSTALQTLFSSK
jgi:8-oxo-dGTP diphosphatase